MRVAQQISHGFGVDIDKDVVRRVLAKHYRPDDSEPNGPSWLSFLAQTKDSLWSVDLYRCESILLRSHWVMLVMDVFTRRIIGFGVEPADIDGVSVCRMFNHAVAGQLLPKRLSSDHDPLFRFHRWLANLRVLEIEEIKSVPWAPVSHPFVERLIGTIRRMYLDLGYSSGTWSTSRGSWIISGPITTRIVFTAPSAVSPRHSAAVRHHPCRLTSPPTRGNRIAAVCF